MPLKQKCETITIEPSDSKENKKILLQKKRTSIKDLYKILENGYNEQVEMELGFALDRSGKEIDAIKHYLSALSGNVLPQDKIHLYFCLASSYRNTNQKNKAKKLLYTAVNEFPNEALFPIMLSLINLDEKKINLAVYTLITIVYKHIKEDSLAPYHWFLKREAVRQRRILKDF